MKRSVTLQEWLVLWWCIQNKIKNYSSFFYILYLLLLLFPLLLFPLLLIVFGLCLLVFWCDVVPQPLQQLPNYKYDNQPIYIPTLPIPYHTLWVMGSSIQTSTFIANTSMKYSLASLGNCNYQLLTILLMQKWVVIATNRQQIKCQ